jgi:hypothetical protein
MNNRFFDSFRYLFLKMSEKSLSKIAIYLIILVFFVSYQLYMLGYLQIIFAATPIFSSTPLSAASALRAKCTPPAVGDWTVDSSCTLTWYSTSWKFRRPITVNNSLTSALTDYQVDLKVETNSLISAGKMKGDCGDIRFTYYNSTSETETLISHWLEWGCNTGSTKIWVKVPYIPASGNSTIYMYYGNSGASSTSDGYNTFIFFDDFTGTTINTTKWSKTDPSGYISQNNQLIISGGPVNWGNVEMHSVQNFDRASIVAQAKYRSTCASGASYQDTTMLWWKDSTAGTSYTDFIYAFYFYRTGGVNYLAMYEDGTSRGNIGDWTCSLQYEVRQILKTGGGAITQISADGGPWTTKYDSSYSTETPLKVGFTHYEGGNVYIDDFIVRKYSSTEPSYVIWHEETVPKNILVKSGGTLNLKTNYNLNFTTFWTYKKPITVSNSGSVLTDYQVNVTNPIYNETGLVGSWHFSEGTDIYAYDSSGNGNRGTLTNGAHWTAGKYGSGGGFDGSNDYVTAPHSSSLSISGPISIVAWIKLNSIPGASSVYIILAKDGTWSGTGTNYQLDVRYNGKIEFAFRGSDSSANEFITNSAVVTDINWHFVTVTYDGSTNPIIYVDGVTQAGSFISGSIKTLGTNTNPLYIGASTGSALFFNGTIDEVKIYNRALSASEISALYNAKARLDYADARFTYYNSTDVTETELNYWMEKDGNFWVKMPYVASGSNTIYMYYGNPTAPSASSGTNTFDIFDDFSSGSLNTNYWTVDQNTAGACSVVSNQLKITEYQNYYAHIQRSLALGNFSVYAKMKRGNAAAWEVKIFAVWDQTASATDSAELGPYSVYDWQYEVDINDATLSSGVGGSGNDNWHEFEIRVNATNVSLYYDGVYKASSPRYSDILGNTQLFGFGKGFARYANGAEYNNNYADAGSTGTSYVDDIRVRKYASPEPTTSAGTEETNSLTGKYIYIYSGGNIYIYSTAGIQQRT